MLVETANRLGLTGRIGARTSPALLEAEAGVRAAAQFRRAARGTAAAMLQLEAACRVIAHTGELLGVPVVFLKGMALHLGERVPLGERSASDVDVMVPRLGLQPFVSALKADGWEQAGTPRTEQHVAPLYHPSGVTVEIHALLRGVRLGDGRGSADADTVLNRGLCQRLEDWPGEAWIVGWDLLAAHLFVHGIAQHGTAPQSYGPFRLLMDVSDLGLDAARLSDFMAGPYRWIARDVGEKEVLGLVALAEHLRTGVSPVEIVRDRGAEALWLRHMVLGSVDEQYRRSLRLGHMATIVPARSTWRTWLRTAWRAVFINDLQVELIYGRPRLRLGYVARRLWRPVDLLVRAARYGAAWVRVKARRLTE